MIRDDDASSTDADAPEGLVYISCPRCGRRVPEPLPRGALVPVVHRRGKGHKPCRFWISVASRPSGEHATLLLETNDSFERTYAQVERVHRTRRRRAVLLDVLSELG